MQFTACQLGKYEYLNNSLCSDEFMKSRQPSSQLEQVSPLTLVFRHLFTDGHMVPPKDVVPRTSWSA